MEVVEQVEVELTEEIVKDFYSEHKNEVNIFFTRRNTFKTHKVCS